MSFLNFVWTTLTNVAATLITFFLGVACTYIWQQVRVIQAQSFWHLHPPDKVLLAISLRNFNPAEPIVAVPTGDALALGEILSSLKRYYPKLRERFYPHPWEPITEWDKTVVLIGGGKSNITARCLLAALDPPLDSRDHEDPKHDAKDLKDRQGNLFLTVEEELLPDGAKRLHKEYAYVIRAPNPLNRDKHVFIIIGAHSVGTYSAAHWISQAKNLRWLWRAWTLRRFLDFILRRPQTDSIQVILQVDVLSQPTPTAIPSIGEARVWYRKLDGQASHKAKPEHMVKKAYYFRAPDNYNALYNHWVGITHTELQIP